jgi:hypothetical protein
MTGDAAILVKIWQLIFNSDETLSFGLVNE